MKTYRNLSHASTTQSSGVSFNYRYLRRLGISDTAATSALPAVRIRSFEAGDEVCSRTDAFEYWFLVISGIVAQVSPMQSSRSVPIRFFGPGNWFGEELVIGDKSSDFRFECLSDADTLALPGDVVRRLFDSEITFSQSIAKLSTDKLLLATESHAIQKLGNSCMKVVLGIAHIIQALLNDADTSANPQEIDIAMPQSIIAPLCGVARTVFSSYVLQLEQRGMLVLSYRGIKAINLPLWTQIISRHRTGDYVPIFETVDELLQSM